MSSSVHWGMPAPDNHYCGPVLPLHCEHEYVSMTPTCSVFHDWDVCEILSQPPYLYCGARCTASSGIGILSWLARAEASLFSTLSQLHWLKRNQPNKQKTQLNFSKRKSRIGQHTLRVVVVGWEWKSAVKDRVLFARNTVMLPFATRMVSVGLNMEDRAEANDACQWGPELIL